jgi:hypothetical protein
LRARRELRPLVFGTLGEGDRKPYLATLSRNARILARIAEVLDAAEARGLLLVPHKGAVLAPLFYGDVGLRPMVDVDLLVRRSQLDAAMALLTELGFERSYTGERFTPRHAHDVAFTDGEDASLTVELHYRLFHEFAGDAELDALFERAIAVEIEGRTRRVLAWDDQLFAVAVHASSHAFGDNPLWLVDVALLAGRASVEQAVAEAERRRVGAACRAALRLAAAMLPGVPTPPCRPGDRVRERLLRAVLPDGVDTPPAQLRSLLARAILTDSPWTAAREVARKLELRLAERGERRAAARRAPAG